MSVQGYVIEHDGSYAGHALSLGERFIFHAVRDDLSGLDERCFDTIEALHTAVKAALAEE